MCSYEDSTSDLDEELPVFDFLQRGRTPSKSRPAEPDLVDLADSGAEDGAGVGAPDVMMLSSDSDDDDDVPLAQRLKQRQESVISASSANVANGKHAEHDSHSNLDRLQLPCRNGIPQQVRGPEEEEEEEEDDDETPAVPQRRPSGGDAKRKRAAKRTADEIQASRDEALRRRRAKESQQQEKESLRLQQEKHRAERKAVADAAKALRPEECVKHMVVAVDPALLQLEGGGTLLASLQTLGCSCAIEKQTLPRSVSWMRRTPKPGQPDGGTCVPEAQVVMHMTVEVFCSLIRSYVQEERLCSSDSGPTLTSWVRQQQTNNPGKILSLVVVDMEKYFRSQNSQKQKKFREAVTNEERGGGGGGGGKVRRKGKNGSTEASSLPEVSRVEVEEAVVHLQLHTGVSVRFLSTWKDFSDHITMATKAVAEAPFKREREQTGFSFYLESEWAGGQRVDRGGGGLLQVWKRQIQQLNRVSADMASAIVAAYPSPQLLAKAYRLCKSEREKTDLLADLLIRRGGGLTSTTRRVGPELSKRLYLTMSSRDPEQALDAT